MITFRKLEEQVFDWRTAEHVTQYMYTDLNYSLDNQRKWFEKISASMIEYCRTKRPAVR